MAEFYVGGQKYVVTVDENLVDRKQNKMSALIIADVGSDHLVDLPGESLSAGSRILAGPEELERLMVGDIE